jgi:hypothetical protein
MDSALERIIIECLDAMEKGQSIDSIIESYPEHSAELKSILETADSLNSMKVAHSLGAQAQSQKRFLEEAAAMQTVGHDHGRPIIMFWRRIAFSAGLIAMILIISSAVVTFASQAALPGDPLYGAKRTIEEFRLSLVTDTVLNDTLSIQFEKERISEIEALLNSGRNSDGLEFSGELLIQEDGSWIIEGLPIEQTEATIISGQLATGHRVKVIANLRDGKLFALEISSQDRLEITPDPESDGIPSPPVKEKTTSTPEPLTTNTPSRDPKDVDFSTETPTTNGTSSPTPTQIPASETTSTPDDAVDDGDETDNSNEEEENSESNDNDDEEVEEDNSGSNDNDEESEEDNSGLNDDEDEEDEEEDNSGSNDNEEEEDEEDNSDSNDNDDEEDEEDNSGSGGSDDDSNS